MDAARIVDRVPMHLPHPAPHAARQYRMEPEMNVICRYVLALLMMVSGTLLGGPSPTAADEAPLSPPALGLARATMCEGIESYQPRSPAVVFSIANGRVAAFTEFDPVPRKTVIYHRWYFRDTLTTSKKLHLKPPKWATYSSIQLRQADIGPWRVEIIGSEGRLLRTLRFSVTE